MYLFPTHLIREIDEATVLHQGIASIDLMERAALAFTEALTERWSDLATPFVLFAGPGNNGGDVNE